MSHLRRPLWVACLALIAAPLGAWAQDVSGAGFYPFRGTARTIGLAGAYTAVADDVGGLQFNPAGMAQVVTRQAGFSIKVNADGEDYWSLAYIEPVAPGKFGGGITYINANDGTGRDDNVYQFTYGQFFMPEVAFGVNLRYHDVDVPGAGDEAFSIDLGALYQPAGLPDWSFGLAVLDIPEPSFTGVGNAKRVFNAGAAWRPDPLTLVSLDWYDIGSNASRGALRLGAERQVTENIAMRAGVTDDVFGVGVSLTYQQFTLDYAFAAVDNAADINMISVLANF